MSHQQSIEETVIIAVIEERLDEVRAHLRDQFLDGELTEFGAHANKLLDLIDEEIDRRRVARRQSTPAADTGEINVVRGRE